MYNNNMKALIRNYLITLAALVVTTQIIPGLTYSGGVFTLLIGALGLMLINWFIVPLLKVTFLPLNLLTLGFFTWVINVVALYILTKLISQFKLLPYTYSGISYNGFVVPEINLNVLMVAIVASFLIGLISQFLHWLVSSH